MESNEPNLHRCIICNNTLPGGPDALDICPDCRRDPVSLWEYKTQQENEAGGDFVDIPGYRVINFLKAGEMSKVWLVEEELTGREMALKLMFSGEEIDEKSIERLMREVKVTGQLGEHPNLVQQYNSGRLDDSFFILMEFCKGGNMDDLMGREGGKLSVETATGIILQVLDGLDYIHHLEGTANLYDSLQKEVRGFVHRDIKPGNILLSDRSSHPIAKIADFGMSKAFEIAGLSGITRTGEIFGTFNFIPYQQVINFRYALPDIDVWAAAACYYYMLTGKVPKESCLDEFSTPVRQHDIEIPAELAEVIDKALIETPEFGMKTALEFKAAIEIAYNPIKTNEP